MANMSPLILFILLQVFDIATTLATIALGGGELNPIVAQMMSVGPVFGLMLSKMIVISLATGGAFLGKYRGIRCANFAFAAILVWNCSIVARLAMA
jgi:hypothetical protein